MRTMAVKSFLRDGSASIRISLRLSITWKLNHGTSRSGSGSLHSELSSRASRPEIVRTLTVSRCTETSTSLSTRSRISHWPLPRGTSLRVMRRTWNLVSARAGSAVQKSSSATPLRHRVDGFITSRIPRDGWTTPNARRYRDRHQLRSNIAFRHGLVYYGPHSFQ